MINLSLVLLASAEINAYVCNAIRWGTDSFVIDIFKINFSKTTMGISKKTEILQTTENSEPTEILKANDCARALAKNLTASNKLAVKGEALLKAIDKTDIPDKMLEEIKKYTADCKNEVAKMRAERKPITDVLLAIRNKFTAVENAIDPLNKLSAAFGLNSAVSDFLSFPFI